MFKLYSSIGSALPAASLPPTMKTLAPTAVAVLCDRGKGDWPAAFVTDQHTNAMLEARYDARCSIFFDDVDDDVCCMPLHLAKQHERTHCSHSNQPNHHDTNLPVVYRALLSTDYWGFDSSCRSGGSWCLIVSRARDDRESDRAISKGI